MKITKFDIRNFKGITHTTIQLSDGTPGNIAMLIGLNESGKTTILEAISHFITEDKDTASLVGTVQQKSAPQDLIPKDRKAAFTGRISVEATVILENADIEALSDFFRRTHDLTLDTSALPQSITVERRYTFEDSTHKNSATVWSLTFPVRKNKSKKLQHISWDKEYPDIRKIWLSGVSFANTLLPKIVYFPTFLFDFPDRIYLEGDNDNSINSYYVQVIQDVLDSQGDELKIQNHIVDRIGRLRSEHTAVSTFMAFLFGRDEKKQIDAVLQKAANQMSKIIFGSWNQILGRNVTGKRVQIEWLLDAERKNAPYLEISIVDGQSTYSLSERSLGFRWFFSFLLFTQFRKNRKDDGFTIFLFDEPAANLHSKAQIKLLESFSKIAQGSAYIIYSTHSHYMVNPLWLEKAYIIKNSSTDYDNEDDIDSFSIRKTDVKSIPYRTFVGSHPTNTTYFQPVLDALDVMFSPLIRASRALIVEGKNDFFPLFYFRRNAFESAFPDIFPGNGAGGAGPLICLFRGWGINFRVLLDDDKAGRQGKRKYMEEYLLKESEVVTLGELSDELKGKSFEGIYQNDVKAAVMAHFNTMEPSKRQYALHFQELLALKSYVTYPETEVAFKPISDWLDREFASPPPT